MQRAAVRHFLLALFLASGLAAGYAIWDTYRLVSVGLALERDVHSRLDRLTEAASALGAAQQAYVAPGQQRGDALTRASVLVQELYDGIAVLRQAARSPDASAALLAVGEAVDALVQVDDRVREHLRADEDLMAADLVYTEARQTIERMTERFAALRQAEEGLAAAERGALLGRGGVALGSLAAFWTLIVVALARVPAAARPETQASVAQPAVVASEQPAPQLAADPAIDLDQAAAVCAELARVTDASALSQALERAARVLDAPGLVVWLGAGEELFPAMAHGYSAQALARLGSVARSADNMTAAAWRSGKVELAAGEHGANGAIVAPLVGAKGAFGVLTAEVRHGREVNASARAVASMIAAQLSTVVAPGPAPSDAEGARGDVSGSGEPERAPQPHAASA